MDLGSHLGRTFRGHLNQLIHSTYQDCFAAFKDQDPSDLTYVQTTLLLRFPNPEGQEFSRQWLEEYVKTFLKNKRSSVRRAAKRTFESAGHNYRPGNVHDEEWEKAMGELEDERAAGARAHTRQVDARAQQRPTHYGSGGKAAWKDKFVSARYFISIVLIYSNRV